MNRLVCLLVGHDRRVMLNGKLRRVKDLERMTIRHAGEPPRDGCCGRCGASVKVTWRQVA